MVLKTLQAALDQDGYQDIRFEEMASTIIKVKNEDINEVNVSEKSGGHARALIGGGYGKYSFNLLEEAQAAVQSSKDFSAQIDGKKGLAEAPVVQDTILLDIDVDPRNISVDDKVKLLAHYCKLAYDQEELEVAEGEYYEQYFKKTFVNNEGTSIEQEQMICGMSFRFTSKRDNLTQNTRLAFGGTQSFADMYDQDKAVLAKVQQTVDLLSAKPLEGGIYDVVLDNEVGGLFIHEAFGHLSEADNLLSSDALKDTMSLGREFGSSILNVVDDPGETGFPGSYLYDDEGVKGQRTYLIKEGKLSGRLHSRLTAGHTGEAVTGHARAKNFEFTPIVRMGNIYIEPGTHSKEDLIAATKKGVYLFGSAGGQTSGDAFTFAVQGGYLIEDGKITDMVRDIALSGDLFTTLKNIDMISDTVSMRKRGGCGKAGQILSTSGNGSPYVRIQSMPIGGK